MALSPKLITLPNGLRVVHQQIRHSRIVHCGFMIDTGTRDEDDKTNGIAHFIEHLVFKGTTRRRAYHILNRIETVGGELNAFTEREKTCFYTTSLKRYADRAVELLADITFNAVFPAKELEKEKRVILEEIEMYEDIPEESIYDDFYLNIFPEQPLGYNILGTKNNVSGFERNDILNFIKDHYDTRKMVLSIVGNISFERVKRLASKYLEHLPPLHNNSVREKAEFSNSFNIELQKDFQQQYALMGSPAYNKFNEKRYALSLLNSILGGGGMNSRLNMGIREKYGYVYQINSAVSFYTDCGLFNVELSTDEKYMNKCMELVRKEFRRLRENKLGKIQLTQAKRQFLGQAAMLEENHSLLMQAHARVQLDHETFWNIDLIFEKIEQITAEQILEVANEVLEEDRLSSLIYTTKN